MKTIQSGVADTLNDINEATGTAFNEFASVGLEEAAEGCRQLNWLGAVALPDMMEFLFPATYLYFWGRCTELASSVLGHHQLGLGIPRGFAKTVFIKLLILYIVLFTSRKYVLIIGASEDLAQAILSDVMDALGHFNIRAIFGNWDEDTETVNVSTKIFYFRGRFITLKAVGQGTAFRGISRKYTRPDVIIFDDAQTKECAMSASQAKEFASWMYGTALKAGHKRNCFVLYVGNMYPKLVIQPATADHPAIYGCMLRNIKDSPDWESIVVGAITVDGESIWEELQPVSQLLAEYQRDKRAGQEAVFLTEVMNDDEANDFGIFDPTKVPEYPFLLDTACQAQFLMIDPSLGKKKSDQQVVGHFKVIDGRLVLWELRTMQVSAPVLVSDVISWCLDEGIPAIFTEAYGYQATLAMWFTQLLEELQVTEVQVIPITRGRQSKVSAILSMLKEVMAGSLLLSPQVRSIIYSEVRNYVPTATNPVDDNLDVASYGTLCRATAPDAINSYLWTTYSTVPEIIDSGMNY